MIQNKKIYNGLLNFFRDRCRTTNNMLGDAYGAAVVEALSRYKIDKKNFPKLASKFQMEEHELIKIIS